MYIACPIRKALEAIIRMIDSLQFLGREGWGNDRASYVAESCRMRGGLEVESTDVEDIEVAGGTVKGSPEENV